MSTLNLPIGTNNSPAAVHQVLELPPGPLPLGSEDPLSSLGQQRYYNKADLIIIVSNSNVSVTSGRWDSFAISLTYERGFPVRFDQRIVLQLARDQHRPGHPD